MNARYQRFVGKAGAVAALTVMAALQLAADPIQAVLTLDTSPGTEQAIGLLRPRAFHEGDLAAVVAVSGGPPRTLLGLSEDREALASALQRAGVRVGAGIGGVRINDNRTVDLAGAIRLACEQLTQRSDGSGTGNAVIVLFGSTDPNLQFQMQAVKTALGAAHARLYAVQIDRAVEQRRTPLGMPPPTLPPVVTGQLMAELAEHSGGRMYRRNWDLREILQHVRQQ